MPGAHGYVRGSRQSFVNLRMDGHLFYKLTVERERVGVEEESMMEPTNYDLSGLSQTSMSIMNSEEGQPTFHRRQIGLTITVEKIDRVLTDV